MREVSASAAERCPFLIFTALSRAATLTREGKQARQRGEFLVPLGPQGEGPGFSKTRNPNHVRDSKGGGPALSGKDAAGDGGDESGAMKKKKESKGERLARQVPHLLHLQ